MPVVTALSPFTNGRLPTTYGDCAGDVVVQDLYIDLTAAQLVLNNIFDLGVLPAGHKVIDAVLIPDDLDTNGAPTIALDVGILTGTPGDDVSSSRVCGAELFSADVAARTAVISRLSLPGAFRITPTEADRSIGLKIQAAPATAAAGRVRLQLRTAPMDHKISF